MARRPRPVMERLFAKLTENEAGCWIFTGSLGSTGYGNLAAGPPHVQGHKFLAHRLTYEYFITAIPEGLHIDHLCRTRACCNPWHLEPVTPKVNAERGLYAMRTHCPSGHPYSTENTAYFNRGNGLVTRGCRECRRVRSLQREQRATAARRAAKALVGSH